MLKRILYWLEVLVVSLLLLVALVLFFESRDPTSVEGSGVALLGASRLLASSHARRPRRGGPRRT